MYDQLQCCQNSRFWKDIRAESMYTPNCGKPLEIIKVCEATAKHSNCTQSNNSR